MPNQIPSESLRSGEVTPLKDALRRMLDAYGLAEEYDKAQITGALRNLLEEAVGNRVSDIFIRNKQVFIRVDSAPLRQELYAWRESLLLRLKEKEPKAAEIESIVLI